MFPSLAHPSWKECDAFTEDVLKSIKSNLIPNYFYPSPGPNIFKAFSMPVDEVKVVIVGLSPYPNLNRIKRMQNATGHAFAIPEGIPYRNWPPSLQVIADCFFPEEVSTNTIESQFDPTLQLWIDQGVLLLNSALTCTPNDPQIHVKMWETFTTKVLQFLEHSTQATIFYFMGAVAINLSRNVYPLKHWIYRSYHPAYHAREKQRFEDNQFKQVADRYKWLYGNTLEWILPEPWKNLDHAEMEFLHH